MQRGSRWFAMLGSVLLQCQLLPAQVAEAVFVYHHGKLSSSPAIFPVQCQRPHLHFRALCGHPAACVGGHDARELPAHSLSLSVKKRIYPSLYFHIYLQVN